MSNLCTVSAPKTHDHTVDLDWRRVLDPRPRLTTPRRRRSARITVWQAESADEAVSTFMALDSVATDVSAGSEDTDFLVMLRAAGAALAEKFRVKSTGALAIADSAAAASAGQLARNGAVLNWRGEDARTNSVTRPMVVTATTSDTPAAGIGVGISLEGESGDETPSPFGAIDAVATDVSAGSEDTRIDLLTRVAGAALAATYGFQATAANRVTFTHAATAARTITIPDASGTVALGTLDPLTLTTAAPATPAASTLYKDSIVKAWVKITGAATPLISDDVNVSSLTDNGIGDWTVNFALAMANTTYCVVVSVADNLEYVPRFASPATGSCGIHIQNVSGTGTDASDATMLVVGDN